MSAVDVYADYIGEVAAASGGIGRPDTLMRNITYLAQQAATVACVAPADLPDFDQFDDGVFYPASNSTFLAAHQANVAALQAAVGG